MTAQGHIGLRERQRLARRHADLQLHQIQPGDHLRHRMLHLQPRVYLEKIKVALRIHQKFHRACIGVVPRARQFYRRFAHPAAQRCIHYRRGRFLDYFLVPPLHRTFTLAQINHVSVGIAKNLNLNMPRRYQIFFEIEAPVAESIFRFRLRVAPGPGQFLLRGDQPHPFSAASRNRFQDNWVTRFLCGRAGRLE